MFRWLGVLALGCSLACTGGDDGDDGTLPPHDGFFEQRVHDRVHVDAAFEFDTVTQFRTEASLGHLEVAALKVAENVVYAGTSGGVYRYDETTKMFGRILEAGPIVDMDAAGTVVYAVEAGRVHRIGGASPIDAWSVGTSSVTSIAGGEDVAYVGVRGGGVHRVTTSTDTVVAATSGLDVVDLALVGGRLFVAFGSTVAVVELSSNARSDVDIASEVRGVGVSAAGGVWVAAADALVRLDATGAVVERIEPGRDSFPTAAFTSVVEVGGQLFTGHDIGASVIADAKIEHYHSRRWIPDERVTDVAIGPGGERWIATAGGISRVWFDTTTFADRAAKNEAFLDKHWRMDGFVDDNMGLADAYDLDSFRTGDHDNDGLWTEMQIGAWCYAYAATKDEQYYEKARRAMDVMMLQIDIPAVTFEAAGRKRGFITRSLVRDDEGAVFEDKKTRDNWHLQNYEGRDYYWKDDTSSDEYAGHYFGIPIFYDLCAKSEAEKQEISDHIRLTTDYLIDNDYLLIDLDGEPTLHGHWVDLGIAVDGLDRCVDKLGIDNAAACLEARHGGGWLNGAEILGHLLATWHITGDRKYYDEYERLFTEEDYGRVVEVIDDTFTVTEPAFANHSDHELGMLAFTTLVRYDPNPDRRAKYVQSLLDFYEYEREEHNPWQVAVIGTVHPGDVDLDGAIQTLMDMPTDWRTWGYDNSHRVDAERWPNDRHGNKQFNRVFAYDEIRTMKWNGSPYVVVGGGSGRSLLSPTPYLLAYWMLRYYEMIE